MSKKTFERKYTYKHVAVILVLFVVMAGVNLIPRSQTVSAPCKTDPKLSQSVKKTERGWPFTYTTKLEPKNICLAFKNGKLSELPATKTELHILPIVLNEAIVTAVILGVLLLIPLAPRKKVIHE